MNSDVESGPNEPHSRGAVRKWVASNHSQRDLFKRIAKQSNKHRAQHRCNVYPCDDGPTFGLIAAATGANRILEIGTGLGYSTLWLAHGCRPYGLVTTIERDPLHAEIARQNFVNEGYSSIISVKEGDALSLLPELSGLFDLIFVDGDIIDYERYLDAIGRILRRGGLLIMSNLFSRQYDRRGHFVTASAIRPMLLDESKWTTAFLENGDCLSVLK